jgi:hypothetical protein
VIFKVKNNGGKFDALCTCRFRTPVEANVDAWHWSAGRQSRKPPEDIAAEAGKLCCRGCSAPLFPGDSGAALATLLLLRTPPRAALEVVCESLELPRRALLATKKTPTTGRGSHGG